MSRKNLLFVIATVLTGAIMTLFIPVKLDENGKIFIKKLEGCVLCPYHDEGGVWTIGYGTTYYQPGWPVRHDDECITESEASFYFEQNITAFTYSVHKSVQSHINQNQFNALTAFAYNVGVPAFERSKLLRLVNHNPEDTTIIREFYRWVYVNGRRNNGLVNRRRMEAKMYFSAPIFYTDTINLSSVKPDEVKAPS